MHLILVLMMISQITDLVDASFSKDNDYENKNCKISAGFNIVTEMSAYFYLMSYSYIMKKKITSLTTNLRTLVIVLHVISIALPLALWAVLYY
jgi:hypothetical protein